MAICFEGIQQTDIWALHTEMVRPQQEPGREAEVVEFLAGEAMFGTMPLPFATFPAIALLLPRADVGQLKSSLASALEALPILAGRCCQNGKAVSLTGEGVPFTVVRTSASCALAKIEESQLLELAHFCRPGSVRAGLDPLMTIKLTIYADGSAVLAMCRAHQLFDGASAWAFLAFWSSLARGETVQPPRSDKQLVRDLMPGSEEQLQCLAQKMIGRRVAATWLSEVLKSMVKVLAPCVDTLFLNNLYGLSRRRVFFSHAEVAAIKEAATPQVSASGEDAWVTTQEALAAYLLITLGRHLLPAHSKGTACVMFLLDARKCLGLPSNQLLGNGLNFMMLKVERLLSRSLPEVAACIHEALTTGSASPERQCQQWKLMAGACEQGMEFDVMQDLQKRKGYDIMIALNNQSKRELPDFGTASGGRAEAFMTDAGPNLILPAKGGIEVLLGSEVFSSAGCSSSGRKAKQALAALRQELPAAANELPTLLDSDGARAAASKPH